MKWHRGTSKVSVLDGGITPEKIEKLQANISKEAHRG